VAVAVPPDADADQVINATHNMSLEPTAVALALQRCG
jgi:hypothetical protein